MVHSSLLSAKSTSERETQDSREDRSVNWAYRLLPVVCVLFIVNILGMTAVMLADPAVEVNRRMSDWFDSTAPVSIPAFVIAIIGLIVVGFLIDRKQGRQDYEQKLADWEARMVATQPAPTSGVNTAEVSE